MLPISYSRGHIDYLRIRRCGKMTSKPFGVNITILPAIAPPDYVGYAKVIVEEGINIVETAGNNPGPVIEVFRNAPYKIYILHKYHYPASKGLII